MNLESKREKKSDPLCKSKVQETEDCCRNSSESKNDCREPHSLLTCRPPNMAEFLESLTNVILESIHRISFLKNPSQGYEPVYGI